VGDGGYLVGKAYLVFAVERQVKDVWIGDFFWYGWKDILPEGALMLMPDTACKPGGEVAKVSAALKELGSGRAPADVPTR
jgi:hypothetical protein